MTAILAFSLVPFFFGRGHLALCARCGVDHHSDSHSDFVCHLIIIIIIIINGLQLTDDSVTRLKNEFPANDPNVVLTFILYQDDNTEETC